MQKQIRTWQFTANHDGIANVLKTEVKISQAFDPVTTQKYPPTNLFISIWDTGASTTVISKRVVDQCSLKPIGMAKVQTAGGEQISNVFLINIQLPNKVGIVQLRVIEGNLGAKDDVLIGMDIINAGDFAVTNMGGKTVFSYRFPSIERIDFVEQNPSEIKTADPSVSLKKVSRNAPCPCGSGKKYKKCCGK